MVVPLKKLLSSILLLIFTFTNVGIVQTYAGVGKGNSKKEFQLKDKFAGKKLAKVKNTLSKKDSYKIIIESNKTLEELKTSYSLLDPKVKVKNIGNNLFQIKISKNSLLAQELSGVDTGTLPETLGEEKVVEPEVFEGFTTDYLLGENIQNLWDREKVGADIFQEEISTKPKINIGILDTGIDANHIDLKNNFDAALSYDFIGESAIQADENGHGTQVAGIVGAGVNGGGVYGINSNSDLVSLKVLDQDGLGTSYDVLEALDYARQNNITVVNLSFGGNGNPAISPVCRAITDAKNAGVFSVVSAGNSSQDISQVIPAGCSDAITVGSYDKNMNKSASSNFGNGVDIYAPGEEIYTSHLNNSYITKNGTSFSAPIVAGLISKELAYNGNASYDEILSNLKNNYNLKTSFDTQPLPRVDTSGTQRNSGTTASGLTLSGAIETPVDYSKMKYYSGYFIHEGKTYGNSLYDESFSFSPEELTGVQVFTYEEYQNILKNTKADFSAMSYPTNGLVGSWDLNGNANDTSGNANHGTPVNVEWIDSGRGDGKKVANFKGNSYINTSNNISVSSEATIGFSFNKYSLSSLWGGVISKRDGSGRNNFQIAFSNGSIHSHFWNVGGGLTYAGYNISGLDLNKWHTITYTYKNPGFLKIYIDGINIGNNTPVSKNILNDTLITRFGNDYYGGNLISQVSNISIYNRALSDSEIQQLYQDGLSTTNNQTSTNTPTFLNSRMYLNPTATYNRTDANARNYISNESLKASSQTTQADNGAKGDPVNLATGEFDYENTLMSTPGKKFPFEFKLNYKNQTYYNGPVGINWDHNYNTYLTGETNGNQLYYNGKLGVFRFIASGTGFEYNPGLKANLVLSGGLYQINYDNGDKEYFNVNKKVSKLQDQYGNNLQFSYSGGLLSQVTDTLGKTINYNYFDHNRLSSVTDFNGKKVELTYFTGSTNSGSTYDLKEIKINNGTGAIKTINFEYSTGGDDTTNHNITKLIDSKGQTYVTNTYLNDRVATQTYGSGTISYNYSLSGSQVTKNTVTDKLGNITEYFYDSNGNNTQTIYHATPSNVTYNYTYNSLGYMSTMTLPKGNGTKYSYDTKGNLTEKRQKADMNSADDNTNDIITSYTYNDKNQVLTQTLPNGTTITNTYNPKGNLLTTTTGNLKTSTGNIYQTTKTFTYNQNGELISSIDGNGNTTNFTYSGGLLTQTTAGTGSHARTNTFTYNNYGVLTTQTDARGNTTTYQINDFNQTQTGITSEGIVKSFLYDANNNKTNETLYLQNQTKTISNTYNVLDELTQSIENYDTNLSRTTNIVYDNNGNITEKQTGSGAKIKYTYNEFAKVKEERILVNPNDTSKDIVTSYTYDTNGNLTSKTDAKGNVTTYTYNNYDQLIKETKADNLYTLYNYHKDSTLSQVQSYGSGAVKLSKKAFIYNGIGKVLKEISYKDPENNTGAIFTIYDYDNNGNVISKIDAKGNETIFSYDEFNNLIETKDAKGNKVVNTYDKNNNLSQKQVIQSNGKITTTSYTYDKDNRLKSETNHLNKTKYYTYNELNQITSIIDEKGNIMNFTYNFDNKIKSKIQITSNGNITTNYTYDERGNTTSITDQNGNVTTYIYNNLNQLTKTIYPDNKVISYTYDKNGNLTSQTDPNGSVTTNSYDNLNRLTSRNIQTGTGVLGVTSESYSYDELGRLVEANDSNNHNLTFSYDNLNRLIQENQSGSTVDYSYDDNNNLLNVTSPNGKTTSYAYDELNRVTSVGFSGSNVASYSYTGILNDDISLGNNTNITQTFDELNRLSSLNNSVKNYNYTYDDVSNITSDSHKNYTYDDIYRLTKVNESLSGGLLESFSYDNAGNRTTDKDNTSYTTNNLNQYTSFSGTTSKSYIYDNNGNLKQNDKYSFSYDYKNRLIQVTSGTGMVAEFQYDVLGRRYEKKTQIETTNYIYSDKNILSEYKTENGKTLRKDYVNGLGVDDVIAVNQEEVNLSFTEREELSFCNDRVLGFTGSFIQYGYQNIVDRCNNLTTSGSQIVENRYYFAKDHLGSIIGITDNSGSVVTTYEYDSYGNFTLSGINIGNTILFTGREYDKEIGLYYYRARYYDSSLGRFISRDPIGQQDDINLYSYTKNNPINFIDSLGLNSKSVISKLISIKPIPEDFLNQMKNEADQVAIYNSTPFIGGNKIPVHTEIIFFKDGYPIGQLGSAPIGGWASYGKESAQNFVNNSSEFTKKSNNVSGCIDGLENSLSNSALTLYGRTTICWHGAYDCYQGTQGNTSGILTLPSSLGNSFEISKQLFYLPITK